MIHVLILAGTEAMRQRRDKERPSSGRNGSKRVGPKRTAACEHATRSWIYLAGSNVIISPAMTPRVSITIPTFNRPAYLEEAIESALAQTYPEIEVLVFDNGTMPETLEVAERAARRDERVLFRRNERDLGMSANFNALADAARGEFMVAIGDDDRLLPEFVETLLTQMTPGVRVVFSNHYLIDGSGRRLKGESDALTRQYGRDQLRNGVIADAERAAWQQSIAMSASLLRTADMQRLRFHEDLNTPDLEFFIRLAQKGARFAFCPKYLMEYRVHARAVTAGGLWSERVVARLAAVSVRPEIEPYKRQLLAPMMVNAVSRCLQQGEIGKARQFLRSHYYPGRRVQLSRIGRERARASESEPAPGYSGGLYDLLGGLLQGFCANLPGGIGGPIYRFVRRASHG
jgi:glycosyltransferase involved in cell wall biosynthesis